MAEVRHNADKHYLLIYCSCSLIFFHFHVRFRWVCTGRMNLETSDILYVCNGLFTPNKNGSESEKIKEQEKKRLRFSVLFST